MTLIDNKNEQNPAVSMQSWYTVFACAKLALLCANFDFCMQTRVLSAKSAADIVRFFPKGIKSGIG